MSFQSLVGREVSGLRVRVVENGQQFVGKIQFMDMDRGRMGMVVDKGELQLFYQRDVDEVIELGDENKALEVKTDESISKIENLADNMNYRYSSEIGNE